MRKVVGFKLELRLAQLARRAKKEGASLSEEGVSEEEALSFLARLKDKLEPSVLFDTLTPAEAAQLPSLSPIPGLAVSLILGTCGAPFEQALGGLPLGSALGRLGELAATMALDDIMRFAGSILSADAEKESCALSPLSVILDRDALAALLDRLNGSKIGVALAETGLSPAPSRAASLVWISKTKTRARNKREKDRNR